jgi:hypothetical protein
MDEMPNAFIMGGVASGLLLLALVWSHWQTRRMVERILERWARSDLERRLSAVERGLEQIKSEQTRRGYL